MEKQCVESEVRQLSHTFSQLKGRSALLAFISVWGIKLFAFLKPPVFRRLVFGGNLNAPKKTQISKNASNSYGQ